MKWVHIVESTLKGGKPSLQTVATAVLEDGQARVNVQGDSKVAAELRARGIIVASELMTVSDGEQFLEALQTRYRGAQLFATGVQSGPAVVPYEMPAAKKAA
jgi:hypothetical protein